MPDVIMIPAGTLADPSWVKPTMQIYLRKRSALGEA